MKALIISDDENVISKASDFFKSQGFDLIIYKWLLKALDNIEEIHPDLIFVSASEYPRHWKTLVQFVKSGIGGNKVAVYLYEASPLSNEDSEKAKALGITGSINSFESNELSSLTDSIKLFFELTDKDNENLKVNEEKAFVQKTGSVMLLNPETQIINTGKVLTYNHNKLECLFDYDFTEIENNDHIPHITYFTGEECKHFSAEIFILNRSTKSCILTIQEFYEEK